MMHSDLGIYVISLPNHVRREKFLGSELGRALKAQFVDAILGKELMNREQGEDIHRSLYSGRIGRMLVPSEIGCSLSHKKALETFLIDGFKYGLILEDDVYFDLWQLKAINMLVEELKDHEHIDLIKLGGHGDYTSFGKIYLQHAEFTILRTVTFGVCSHGYLVSRGGAEKLIQSIEPITEPYDTFLRSVHRHRCEIFESSPWLVSLDEDNERSSSISNERTSTYSVSIGLHSKIIGLADKISYNFWRLIYGLRRFGLSFIFKNRMMLRLETKAK